MTDHIDIPMTYDVTALEDGNIGIIAMKDGTPVLMLCMNTTQALKLSEKLISAYWLRGKPVEVRKPE